MNAFTKVAALTLAVAAGSDRALAQGCPLSPPRYSVTIIPNPQPPEEGQSVAYALNNHGDVVGAYQSSGFSYDRKSGTTQLHMNFDQGMEGACLAINDDGWIGGRWTWCCDVNQYPAAVTPTGQLITLNGQTDYAGGEVAGINSAAALVGYKFHRSAFLFGPAYWSEPDAFGSMFGSACGGCNSCVESIRPADINDSGRIVGRGFACPIIEAPRAFIRDVGSNTFTYVNLLPGDVANTATSINNEGQIAGYASTEISPRPPPRVPTRSGRPSRRARLHPRRARRLLRMGRRRERRRGRRHRPLAQRPRLALVPRDRHGRFSTPGSPNQPLTTPSSTPAASTRPARSPRPSAARPTASSSPRSLCPSAAPPTGTATPSPTPRISSTSSPTSSKATPTSTTAAARTAPTSSASSPRFFNGC